MWRDRENVICHSLWMMRSECFLNLQDANKAAVPDRAAKGALDLGDSCEAAAVSIQSLKIRFGMVQAGAKRCTAVFSPLTQPMF
jgi:hypothetical protein